MKEINVRGLTVGVIAGTPGCRLAAHRAKSAKVTAAQALAPLLAQREKERSTSATRIPERSGGATHAPAASKPAVTAAAAAAVKKQTAAEAKADMRAAIAESQGLPAPANHASAAAPKVTASTGNIRRLAAYQPDARRYAVTSSEHYAGRERLAQNLLGKGLAASDIIAALRSAPRAAAENTAKTQSVWDKAIAANWPGGFVPGFGKAVRA